MYTRFDVTSATGAYLEFRLDDINNGFEVRDILGLEPVDAIVASSDFAQVDGTNIDFTRLGPRTIIFKLGMNAGYGAGTVRELRKKLYSVLSPQSEVTITFYSDDGSPLSISGISQTFVAPIFTDDPEATISVFCQKPAFRSTDEKVITGWTSDDIYDPEYLTIDYEGDQPSGFIFELLADQTITVVNIMTRRSGKLDGYMGISPSIDGSLSGIGVGQRLRVSTVPGAKTIEVSYLDDWYPALDSTAPDTQYIQLFPGENEITVLTQTGSTPIQWTLTYTDKIGGL